MPANRCAGLHADSRDFLGRRVGLAAMGRSTLQRAERAAGLRPRLRHERLRFFRAQPRGRGDFPADHDRAGGLGGGGRGRRLRLFGAPYHRRGRMRRRLAAPSGSPPKRGRARCLFRPRLCNRKSADARRSAIRRTQRVRRRRLFRIGAGRRQRLYLEARRPRLGRYRRRRHSQELSPSSGARRQAIRGREHSSSRQRAGPRKIHRPAHARPADGTRAQRKRVPRSIGRVGIRAQTGRFHPHRSERDRGRARMKVSVPAASFIEFPKEEIELSISERFERQAAKFPPRVAVKSADGELTYDDLNRAANRLARAILARRGPDEEPVALLFEQGPAAIVAIMGALKAGKIYVPLDPLHFPPAKLAAMLEDSGAALVVTDGKNLALGERLADGAREVIVLDRLDPSANAENPGLVLTADRLAYILYTSGSTGEAKGVAQSHRNVLHFIRNYTNDLHVGPEDRQSLLYSCSVAASVKNIFGALLNGAALVSLNLKAEGPARLAAWLEQEGITLCQMVPTVFRHFAGRLTGREAFPSLRGLYLGGEPLFRRDIELYRAHFPKGCVLVNALASTELNTLRQFFITHVTDIADAVVPVGYPVEDTEILLLDESGAAVGPDCVGEIAIRSRYLAVGYWRKPELTRLAFAADTEGSDKRIYRTADLGRMRSDGCLECLGRKDFQVKIRGHRVEIGEIEATLLALANVREAVVVALNESAEEKRLAAYIVPARMPAPDAAELRHALAERLPDYMIPSSFMIAESLPVSAMGKVNVRALTADGGARPSEMPLSVAPTTPLETSLAAIWAETLGKESVGVHDNFFDLGGDSLLAAQILSRTQDLLDIDLPLSVLFEKPTIAELAGHLHRLQSETESRRPRAEADRSLLVRVRAGGDKPPFFYLHGDILRGALYSTNLARYLGDDRPFYALAPHGLNGTEIPPTIA